MGKSPNDSTMAWTMVGCWGGANKGQDKGGSRKRMALEEMVVSDQLGHGMMVLCLRGIGELVPSRSYGKENGALN
jgi:hypothetical protein